MEQIITVNDLTKTFTLSKKQQKLQKTMEKNEILLSAF